ncbi:hypothetical protein DL93DRAFT_2125172 [Clavulina sp. PMI_390]|nr:hypothetical protein DL93DRAFT_2125172 [Clavulina sp. PMI_390]
MSAKPKVVLTRYMGPEAKKILDDDKTIEVVLWEEDRPCTREWLLENVKGAAGIICASTEKINEELLNIAGPSLKVVSTMSVGMDHVDAPGLVTRGIKLGYTPDVLNEAVADITVMLALMATRIARIGMKTIDNDEWPTKPWAPFGFSGTQISAPGTVVGFCGFGRIAQSTLHRLVAFGVKNVVYYSRSPSPDEAAIQARYQLESIKHVTLLELAEKSDLIIVLTPGGKETYHMIGEEFFNKCKKTATLVNTARGTVVDSNALANALRENKLWSAGLDVVEGEPNVDSSHPLVKEPKCVIVPHIGSATLETRTDMATTAASNLVLGLANKPMIFQADLK